ncbi:ethanolamine utilization protein EutQ [Medicago truncatula]|uniref:Ethanolamine utilization protein EutQ n=1 Tax=Medicago truncatula TaxID=3880 RepID=G7KMX0_MEDTR|nr:ethanolamine utilization protein EutQ [Medicago truncatula]
MLLIRMQFVLSFDILEGKFPWTYDSKETCYLLEGKVKVTPNGANELVEFGAGDLVVFPKGMCLLL